jgi:hypothetical protein
MSTVNRGIDLVKVPRFCGWAGNAEFGSRSHIEHPLRSAEWIWNDRAPRCVCSRR